MWSLFADTLRYLSFISIARTLGGNPSWYYGHILLHPAVGESAAVTLGNTLGYMAQFTPDPANNHLHFYLEEEVGNLTQSACNPRTPLGPLGM